MLSRIHQKLGTAGFVISIVALIAALGGTAAALTSADKSLIKKEAQKYSKQESKKFSKKFAKVGPAGAAGATGAAGPAGPAGKDGAPGTPGAPGAAGKTPEMTTFAGAKAPCTEGGVEFKIAPSTALACNGKKGADGPEGPEGTFGSKPLPSGQTLTGAWTLNGAAYRPKPEAEPTNFEATQSKSPISFPLQLTAAPAATITDSTTTECPGLVNGVPTATAGNLCIYVAANLEYTLAEIAVVDPAENFEPGGGKTGAVLFSQCTKQACYAHGTWAVKAP